jgi:amidase
MKPRSREAEHQGIEVDRRELLRGGAAAAVTVAVGVIGVAADPQPALQPQEGRSADTVVPPFELDEATIADLQAAMTSGQRTARSIVEAYLTRIEAIDRTGPTLRSVIEVNPDAVAIAEELDAERRARGARGPLHGIPVLIKDNIATGDRMETTAGSLAMVGAKAVRDAHVAARLREAGAVILGKTNLSEWANFRSSHSSSGWSGRGGQCANPYVLDRNPCGSSSGTGAAISASLATVGVGTETDGSIVCPSHACGLVGIKPTVGLVSRSGIIPISHTQDTAGPMARTVTDAALLLWALVGSDPDDEATLKGRGQASDYAGFLTAGGLKGARIGVARKLFFGYSDAADRLVEEAIALIKGAGAIVVDPADIPHAGEYDAAELEVLLYEFKADLNAYLQTRAPNASVHNLKEIIEFNERNRDREMPFFGQDMFERAQAKGPLSEKVYRAALEKCGTLSRRKGLDVVFSGRGLDAIVAPTGGPPWTTDVVNGDHFLGAASTPAAVSGYPSITVPAGHTHGLPVGLTFIGKPWGEGPLIRLAYAFEHASSHRRPPTFLPTLSL